MHAILHIIRKEFQQIRRNKTMLPMLGILPIVQLIVLSYAADFEVKNLKLAVADKDMSSASRLLINKFTSSGYFQLTGNFISEKQLLREVERDNADLVLIIPHDFDKMLTDFKPVKVQLLINAVNNQKAGIASGYSREVISLYNKERLSSYAGALPVAPVTLTIRESFWYNPALSYRTFMVPGILAILVTVLTAFLSSVNIIREKELGTIEQLNVTPITKFEFIIGKLVPFWLIGMFLLAFGLIVSYLMFGITVEGSILLLFSFCAIYIIVILGIGILISTVTETQQQAMFITWFFMVIFILLSGLFTPVDSIPQWTKIINIINPMKYFVEVMRMVMLKGSGWAATSRYFLIMSGFAVLFNFLAITSYKKRNK